MAFNRPNLRQLLDSAIASINANVPNADARLRFSLLNAMAQSWAALVDGLYAALVYLSRQLFLVSADREFLTKIADSYGIYRLQATVATGCIYLQGVAGTAIAVNAIFQRADGMQYQTTSSVILPVSGYIDVPCIALTQGVIGNTVANTQLRSAVAIAGLTLAQVCSAGIGGGADIESDDQLRARTQFRLRNAPGAGTTQDWLGWAFKFNANVTRVWVVPTIYGNGTVGIVFAQDNLGVVPNAATVTAMQAHLAQFTPVGSIVYVFAPTLVSVNFSIHEVPNADPVIRQNISNELSDLLYREGGPGSTIPISHVNEAISNAAGEFDHVLIAPNAPLTFGNTTPVFELGVLGSVSWV